MKSILLLCSALTLLMACNNDPVKMLEVTGTIKGLKKGVLYLQHLEDETLVTVDSVAIKQNGNFTLSTSLESPELFYLYLNKEDNNSLNDRIAFFAEPTTITINTTWDAFERNATITGSTSQKELKEYQRMLSKFNKRSLVMAQSLLQPATQNNALLADSLETAYNNNTKRSFMYALNFAFSHKNSYVAPYIGINEIPEANTKLLDSLYSVLPDSVANSKYGKALKKIATANN